MFTGATRFYRLHLSGGFERFKIPESQARDILEFGHGSLQDYRGMQVDELRGGAAQGFHGLNSYGIALCSDTPSDTPGLPHPRGKEELAQFMVWASCHIKHATEVGSLLRKLDQGFRWAIGDKTMVYLTQHRLMQQYSCLYAI